MKLNIDDIPYLYSFLYLVRQYFLLAIIWLIAPVLISAVLAYADVDKGSVCADPRESCLGDHAWRVCDDGYGSGCSLDRSIRESARR